MICGSCKVDKPEEAFYLKSKLTGKRQSKCKECHKTYLKGHYHKRKETYLASAKRGRNRISEFVREAKSVPCADCGNNYPYYVMDFDHKSDKVFNISRSHTVSKQALLEEIDKCDVVCSNCHRIRTHNRLRSSTG